MVTKSWPKRFLDLKPRYRRIINNFMSSRSPDMAATGHAYNWMSDCKSYGAPAFMHDYYLVSRLYNERGYITEM